VAPGDETVTAPEELDNWLPRGPAPASTGVAHALSTTTALAASTEAAIREGRMDASDPLDLIDDRL
jgi:hypothetical protein